MRDTLEFICGAVTLGVVIGILLTAYHRSMKRMYRRIARDWADELFRAYVRSCEYRVHTTVYTTITVEDGDTYARNRLPDSVQTCTDTASRILRTARGRAVGQNFDV